VRVTRWWLVVLVVGASACSSGGASAPRSPGRPPPTAENRIPAGELLGFGLLGNRSALWRLDPVTLRRLGAPAVVGDASSRLVLSPDRRTAAVGSQSDGNVQLVDLAGLSAGKPFAVLAPGHGCCVEIDVESWPRPDRLLATVTRAGIPPAVLGTSVAIIDPLGRRVVKRIDLHGSIAGETATPSGDVVVLVAPKVVGHPRLVVVSPDGITRQTTLAAFRAGFFPTGMTSSITPSLAVNPAGDTAVVVDARRPVIAQVSLATLGVRLHRVATLGVAHLPIAPAMDVNAAGIGVRTQSGVQWLSASTILVRDQLEHPAKQPTGWWGEQTLERLPQVVSTRTWRVIATLPESWCRATAGVITCPADGQHPNSTRIYTSAGRFRYAVAGNWSELTLGRLFASQGYGHTVTEYRLASGLAIHTWHDQPNDGWPIDLTTQRHLDKLAPAADPGWGF
jgi:hypothetical protein